MDRHTNWRPERWLPAGARLGLTTGLAVLAAGCVPQTLPVAPEAPAAVKAAVHAEDGKGGLKRVPQASTCVAFGDFNLRASADGEHTAAQREQLLDQARRAYQQALKTDPKCREAYVGLTRAYERMGDHARAVETYHAATTAFPGDAAFRFELGMCHARKKEWDAALDAMNAALAIDAENRTYGNMLAYTLARAGRFDDSFAAFQRLTGDAQAHYNVARMLHHVGQDGPARDHLAKALAAEPAFAPARDLLAALDGPKPHTAAVASENAVPATEAVAPTER